MILRIFTHLDIILSEDMITKNINNIIKHHYKQCTFLYLHGINTAFCDFFIYLYLFQTLLSVHTHIVKLMKQALQQIDGSSTCAKDGRPQFNI